MESTSRNAGPAPTGKLASMGRRFRRAVRTEVPQGFHPPRHKTGQPAWFRQMQLDVEIRRALSRIPLAALSELSEATRESLKLGGFDNIWKLSRANAKDLLKCKGIGPATLRNIRASLVGHQVPVSWEAS